MGGGKQQGNGSRGVVRKFDFIAALDEQKSSC